MDSDGKYSRKSGVGQGETGMTKRLTEGCTFPYLGSVLSDYLSESRIPFRSLPFLHRSLPASFWHFLT